MRLFLFGDYEFECRMYGITGAQGRSVYTTYSTCTCSYTVIRTNVHAFSGRHPCLWCIIRSDAMKVPRGDRGRCQLRTLDPDILRFQTTGKGDLKQAKLYNNVISRYFFDIPISQVGMQVQGYRI